MRHQLKNLEKENISKKISSYLKRSCGEIAFAYLFGSFVTGRDFSDIDLGIVTKSGLENPLEYELSLESKLENLVKYHVDARVLNSAPLSFCYNVIRDRKVIVDRDRNLRADFEGRIVKEYSDFAPFRRRYLEEVRNAPV